MACYSIKTRPFIKIMPTTLLYLPCLKLQMGYRLGFFVIFLGGGVAGKETPGLLSEDKLYVSGGWITPYIGYNSE